MPLTIASIPWEADHHVNSNAVESLRAPLPRLISPSVVLISLEAATWGTTASR